ncbi:RNA polymerase sigma factor [Pantoea agglomerans]|jgi:RNA polymerase sigma factor (sigma-70 family)|uniref:RNA polymerase sigma factor n=1 Tax=Pantoea TaxID=53335 RepID=UPI0002553FF2|nr:MULTISPECIES: RNA polymerase sigma factor [Pantoea]AZI50805.1 RNA polymerase sigma factor [Pantoea agglomerans]KAF6639525.1 RNA polymerase sigma factor [Pantoea sp. EKM10T]KAF6678981.1 RNA polymerase sigma factor [Pantoea sp. EKM21T]KAF6683634.1 RNA polymerase sigma factor [Pantoea sp. EKM20T]KAF6686103.1 RNA polymerase sigma factor [Pantoea sp. EKM22T]
MINSTLVSAVAESPLAINVNWDEIFVTHNKKLLNFIRKRIASHEDADDILQMTCLEVLCNRHKFRGASRPETWVFGIAVNLIRNYYKSKQIHYLFDNLNDEVIADLLLDNDPSDLTENRQLLSHTLASLEILPKDVRVMLSILVEEEGSYQDIAQQLEIPVGTVRSRLSRARETLKGRIYA